LGSLILGTIIGSETKITDLLHQLRAGDESARDELMRAVYGALHRIARSHLRKEREGHTLQPTALVNEAYVKLIGRSEIEFADRAHFFATVSLAMRRILIDHARARVSRGGARVPLGTIDLEAETGRQEVNLLDLDLALEALAREQESLARLIEMRYFGGMTAEESATVLSLSPHIVRRELRLAQAWLHKEIAG
jgi:RNA polymerase sigma-70 factor, ECF subfamily